MDSENIPVESKTSEIKCVNKNQIKKISETMKWKFILIQKIPNNLILKLHIIKWNTKPKK